MDSTPTSTLPVAPGRSASRELAKLETARKPAQAEATAISVAVAADATRCVRKVLIAFLHALEAAVHRYVRVALCASSRVRAGAAIKIVSQVATVTSPALVVAAASRASALRLLRSESVCFQPAYAATRNRLVPWALESGVGGRAVGDSEEIHGESNAHVDEHSSPDGLGAKCQGPQDGSSNDGGEGLCHWLAEVNHAVGHQHHEDGTRTKARCGGLENKAAEEEL